MKIHPFYPIVFALAVIAVLPALDAAASEIDALRNGYASTKREIAARREAFAARYREAASDEEKRKVIQGAREYLFDALTEKILPAWLGTPWDYNGTTRTPGEGKIACGTLVVYALQDAGFKIPSKMSRQPSENIIKNLIGSSDLGRFWNSAPMEKVLGWVRSKGEGIYIVGLDIHVGFILYKNDAIAFFHSSYYNPPRMVVRQDPMERSPLTDSKYRVMGKILTDGMVMKWISGQTFPLTHDYFGGVIDDK